MAKRSASAGDGSLHFRGLPHKLTLSAAALAGNETGELVLPKELAAHATGEVIPLAVRRPRFTDPSVRLSLDRRTPAGRYSAELKVGGKSVPVTIDIAPNPRLSVFPLSVDFSGKPGADPEIEISLVNTGNVAIDLPERSVTGLFDDEGLETAFAETYRAETDDPAQLLGQWLRSLRQGYGGLLKLRIVSGSGALPPGDERTIVLSGHIPENVKRGHSYHAIWELGPVNYRITVAVERG